MPTTTTEIRTEIQKLENYLSQVDDTSALEHLKTLRIVVLSLELIEAR